MDLSSGTGVARKTHEINFRNEYSVSLYVPKDVWVTNIFCQFFRCDVSVNYSLGVYKEDVM